MIYKYKQRIWNKCSAGLVYDLSTHKKLLKPYYFTDNTIKVKRKYFHRYLSDNYLKKINKITSAGNSNLRIKYVGRRLLDFIENPRIPSLVGIGDTIKLLK